MAGRRKSVQEDIAEVLEPMGDVVIKATEAVGELATEAVKKAAPTVKAMAEKAEPTVRAAKKAVRATSKKAAKALCPEVYVQWNDRELDCIKILERAKNQYKADNRGMIVSCKLYIKPQEGVAYYVINDETGKVIL